MAKQTYIAKRPLAHGGKIVAKGEPVEMHPQQAKYLIGTHLEAPAAADKKAGGKSGKATAKDKADAQAKEVATHA
jgi:hypothetical protein